MSLKVTRNKGVVAGTFLSIVAVIFSSCLFGKSEEKEREIKPLALPVFVVDTSNASTVKNYLGTIEGKVNVEIRSQAEGLLQEIYVDEGQYVKKGQKLFKIDASPYQEVLNNAIASQNVAKAKLQNAKIEVERLKPLVEHEVIADVRLKSVESDYNVAKATLDQATAAVRSAEINKQFTIITAPTNGYIGRIPKRVGNLAAKGDREPLTVLSDIQEVYVYFAMNEADFIFFSKIKAKKDSLDGLLSDNNNKKLAFPEVTLILADGEPYPIKGKVDAVNGQVDRSTGAISLRASFSNRDNILRTGSTGTLVVEEVKKNVLLVPQIATNELQDKTFVYILDTDNKVHRRTITISGKSKDNYIVSSGLNSGDRVVLSGFDKLTDGSVIVPIEQKDNKLQ